MGAQIYISSKVVQWLLWDGDDILALYVKLFKAVSPNFIFMDDNAHPHQAQLLDDFLVSKIFKEWNSQTDHV